MNRIEEILETKRYYHLSFYTGNKVCDKCPFRGTWSNFCKRFLKPIKKVKQSNGGFHHEPCQQCIDYLLKEEDINFLKWRYNYES